MKDFKENCRIVIVQAEPVLFDKQACVDKVVKMIGEAAQKGADLIVFPELFIPGYPFGMNFGFSVGERTECGREDYKRYYDASILADGPETKIIGEAAKAAGAFISLGVSERDPVNGTLYNSNFTFDDKGNLVAVKRKLKPTGSERNIWGDAHDPDTYFPIVDSPWEPIGCLICWETYMPLARVALYEKGITIYISANTNDNPEWQDTCKHIAREGRLYFVNADLYFTKSSYPDDLNERTAINALPDIVCRGGSCVVDPYGHYVNEPVWDKEALIVCDIDIGKVPAAKMEMDCVGHYTRPDILKLHVNYE